MFHVLQRAAQTNPTLKAVDWANPVPTDPGDWEINPEALLRVRTSIAATAAHPGPVADPEDVTAGHQDGDDGVAVPSVGEHLEAEIADGDGYWTAEVPVDVG